MADRELLEKAAKAAGIKALRDPSGVLRNCTCMDRAMNIFAGEPWNPLTDDGDALRLAVKLGLLFKPEFAHFLSLERFAGQEHDDYSAHRRAIVRAAAAIGEKTP